MYNSNVHRSYVDIHLIALINHNFQRKRKRANVTRYSDKCLKKQNIQDETSINETNKDKKYGSDHDEKSDDKSDDETDENNEYERSDKKDEDHLTVVNYDTSI